MVKKVKSKYLLAILGVLLIGIAFIFTAYLNGKTVVEEDINLNWVSHTEYWREDSASTIVRLSDYKGKPTDIDECRVTILYPDKSTFIDNQLMQESNIPGNWYRTDYLGDAPLGTYEQEVTCTKGNSVVKSSQSFHLNPALEQVNTLTEKSDNLDLKLEDVNLVVTGQISDTGEVISTNLTNMNTSLNTLLDDVNGSLSSQLQDGISTLQTDLSGVSVSLAGTVQSTGQEIQTSIENSNTNLSDLLSNINGDLSDQISFDFNALESSLNDVSINLTGTVLSTGEDINTNITTSNTNLTNLINTINSDLLNQLEQDFNTSEENLVDVNLSLNAKMEETGDEINTNLTNVSTSLTNLLNTVNTDVSNKIDVKFAELSNQLTDVNLALQATVTETGEEINTNLTNVSTSLTDLLNSVNVNLTSEITNQFNNTNALIAQKFLDANTFLDSELDNLEVSINGKVESTGQVIETQITDVNNSLSTLMTSLVVDNLNVQLEDMLSDLTQQITAVKQDSSWIVSNAVNQDDMQEIRNRFSSVDSNLALIENFCSNPETESSALCQEITNIKNAIQIMDTTQEQKLNELDTVTTNTWNLLSGDITTKIDSLLVDVGIIKAQTTDINSTVHQILENQESDISIRIIS